MTEPTQGMFFEAILAHYEIELKSTFLDKTLFSAVMAKEATTRLHQIVEAIDCEIARQWI